jgi:DNA-binding transcriptional LysR family regulator
MNYTLNQLRIFLKVVEFESVTKAAEVLHLTQPAVSIQLKNLQQQFDIPLTEVINKRIYITEFGREVARVAEIILREVDAMDQRAAAFHGKMTGSLRFSVVSTGKYVLPFYLTGYLKQHPHIDLGIDVTNRVQVIRDLEMNKVDFSLISYIPDNMNLNMVNLLDNDLYLIGSPEHQNSKRKEDNLNINSSIIFRESGSATRLAMEKFFKDRKMQFRKKIELTSNEAVKQAIIAGLGYSIMPLIGLKNELQKKEVKIIPYPGLPLNSQWNLVWLKDKKLSPAAEGFLQYLEQEKSKIFAKHFRWISQFK